MRKLFILLFVLITLSSCDIFLEKKENKTEVVNCYARSWCDEGETKTFYDTGLFTYGILGPGTKSNMYLTYNKSSKIFDLQIKRITRFVNEFYKIGANPDTNGIDIFVKGGAVVERIDILNMTEDKISFKSRGLEKSFKEEGKYEISYEQSWMDTIYEVSMKL